MPPAPGPASLRAIARARTVTQALLARAAHMKPGRRIDPIAGVMAVRQGANTGAAAVLRGSRCARVGLAYASAVAVAVETVVWRGFAWSLGSG
jgi:hypothetical protein